MQQATVTVWCNLCQSEPAVESIEIEAAAGWIPLDVGEACLALINESWGEQ